MSTLTIRLPDDKYDRLKMLAKHRHISINKLMEELSTIALSEFDAETRFLIRASCGEPKKGLEVLNKLDVYFKTHKKS
jgi:predicted transcriptional regulator